MKVTIITGKPCTGKTTLARSISSTGKRCWFSLFQLENLYTILPVDTEYAIFDGVELTQKECEFIRVVTKNPSFIVKTEKSKQNRKGRHLIEPHFIFITNSTTARVKSLFKNTNIQIIKCVKLFSL